MDSRRLRNIARKHPLGIAMALAFAALLAAALAGRPWRVAVPAAGAMPAPSDPAGERTMPTVISASCPTPAYPPASRQMKESGVVMLNFLVGADGHVLQSRVETSSGHEALDEAARLALSHCLFKPGTLNGRPEASWHFMKYVWTPQR
ncbi:MAG: Gram-negative bacterial tonB protein [Massilia sp.]|nr:Gram-negative bacterial tonB protein [Massilia sp.]